MLDFAYIRKRARQLSGRLSANQLSDADLNAQINAFYLVDLNVHVRYPGSANFKQLVQDNDVPANPLFAEFISAGTARTILLSSGDMAKFAEISPYFDERLVMIQQDLDYMREDSTNLTTRGSFYI